MKISWDERFGADVYFYGKEPNAFVAEMAEKIPAGPVLCLAEGEGRNAVFLAQRGHEVTAVDQAATGMAKAGRLAEYERQLKAWKRRRTIARGKVAKYARLVRYHRKHGRNAAVHQ